MRLSKKSFNAWLSEQKASRKFLYPSNFDCLVATWLKETGVCECPRVYPSNVLDNGKMSLFPKWLLRVDQRMRDIIRDRDGMRFVVGELRNALKP